MLVLPPIDLTDAHVRLRPLVREDAPELARAAAEGRDSYAFTPVPDGALEAERYVARALEMKAVGQRYAFAVLFQGRVVGSTSYADYQPWRWHDDCALARTDRPDALEIGYTWLAASVQRTPCNTACKRLLLAHAFDVWQVHRVLLKTDARNQRSRRAIERLGARFDGVLRGHTAGVDCTVRDSAYYSILIAEWPEVKRRLDGMLAARG